MDNKLSGNTINENTNLNGVYDSNSACGELKDKASKLTKEAKEMTGIAKMAAMEVIEQLKSKGTGSISEIAQTVGSKKEDIESYVKKSPTKSVLMGVGAGALLGLLLSNKKNK